MNKKDIDLSIDFCGVRFKNPFLLSSSPVSNSAEMVARSFEAGWSGVVFKTLNSDTTPIIHPSPRMNDYGYGNKKLVGLQNVEMISDRPLKDNLADFLYLKKKYPDHVLISSIMGFSNDEWAYLAKVSEDNGADMLELNFSCPHMSPEKHMGALIGQDSELTSLITKNVKENCSIPVMVKLTPNVTSVPVITRAAKNGGADAISAINTVLSLIGVDIETGIPMPSSQGKSSFAKNDLGLDSVISQFQAFISTPDQSSGKDSRVLSGDIQIEILPEGNIPGTWFSSISGKEVASGNTSSKSLPSCSNFSSCLDCWRLISAAKLNLLPR